MPTVFDANAYINSLGCSGLTVQMKVLYEGNRLSARLLRRLIFQNRCEGWMNGPVYPDLWNNQNERGNPELLPVVDRKILSFVFGKLGRASGKNLSARSHRFPEWIASRNGLSTTARGNREITFAAMTKALGGEVHIEDGGAVYMPLPDNRDALKTLKHRMSEIVFFQDTLSPLLSKNL